MAEAGRIVAEGRSPLVAFPCRAGVSPGIWMRWRRVHPQSPGARGPSFKGLYDFPRFARTSSSSEIRSHGISVAPARPSRDGRRRFERWTAGDVRRWPARGLRELPPRWARGELRQRAADCGVTREALDAGVRQRSSATMSATSGTRCRRWPRPRGFSVVARAGGTRDRDQFPREPQVSQLRQSPNVGPSLGAGG